MAGVQQVLDDNGDPLAAGKVTFYEPGTTTLKDTYTEADLATANTNPVILDSNGRPDNATGAIWLNGEYKYKFTTSADVAVGATIDNLNVGVSASTSGGLQQPLNGSFEDDTDLDNTPDNWTLSRLTDGTIATDTTDQAHGKTSLLFTSGGSGGGTATSTRFDVLAGGNVIVRFTYKSSSATSLNKVDLKTYDKDDGVVSTLSVHTLGAAGPTSYTTYEKTVAADATAVRAELIITGIDASSTTKTAGTTSNFDGISIETNRVQGIVILDTPELLASSTAITSSVWNTVDSATLNSATASKAIIRVFGDNDGTTSAPEQASIYASIRKTGTAVTLAQGRIAFGEFAKASTATVFSARCSGEGVVNLDGSFDFDYAFTFSAGGTLNNADVYLVGYYV